MRLIKLRLTNFKGLKSFSFTPDGENCSIYGDNGTGKTTIIDAVSWLLFDKDSNFKSQFEIKTLDSTGEAQHGLSHEAEGLFLLDTGKTITLTKCYEEQWTKKRGSTKKEFTGHKTSYHIDGVPVKKKDFTEQIKQIADEEEFKLLTSPAYFSEQLHWQDRRNILLKVCGDISDEDVFYSRDILKDLHTILNGRALEDHRKVINAKRADINKELEKIPVRIDEAHRQIADLADISQPAEEERKKTIEAELEERRKEQARIKDGGEIAQQKKELAEVESELIALKNKAESSVNESVVSKERELQAISSQHQDTILKLKGVEGEIELKQKRIASAESQMSELREQWHLEDKKTLPDVDGDSCCPTCGQELPIVQIEAARKKALENFNKKKAQTLTDIQSKGAELKAGVEVLRENINTLRQEVKNLSADSDKTVEKVNNLRAEIKTIRESSSINYQDSDDYENLIAKKERISSLIATLRDDSSVLLVKVGSEVDKLNASLKEVNERLQSLSAKVKTEKRIEELKEQEKTLSAEYENLERELYLIEEFTRSKVDMLESKINSKFKMARFKLFAEQINGGLNECCEVLYNGVPYSSGLNNAARINVGLDVISTLSAHYGKSMPVFIDNAESVVSLIDIDTQLIRLVVSEQDKELRIETKQMKEAA